MNNSSNPFNAKLEQVIITKFNGSDRMSIMPQIAEFTLHQSIFSTMLKADMVVIDGIGLMNNYPWSGEEVVTVELVQDGEESVGTGQKQFERTLTFIINAMMIISSKIELNQNQKN